MGILEHIEKQVHVLRFREVIPDDDTPGDFHGGTSPLKLLEQDILFAAEQLGRARDFRKQQLEEIHRTKFYTYREWRLVGPYGDARHHADIKERLLQLDAQRRRLEWDHEQVISGLQRHLFGLLKQRAALE